ncbi:MAG TPA: COX15/CtaA family protein [Bacteroidia bacterium]|nr:COX15/CtaA family protein [Bacteroidia bacterium]
MRSYNHNIVLWLFSGCFLIFTMVIVGGITRLTGSGLSITEWKLVRGTVPPLNEQQWNEEFDNYKQIPQYREMNYDYTLNDFKKIYFWEYIHRLIGRLIGIVFLIPFLYFWFTKQLSKPLFNKLLFLFFLGGLQGFLGWYMVKSGLVNNIRVSHLRLATHLITAFITFGFTFWVMLEIIPHKKTKENSLTISLRKASYLILILVVLQIIYGAFVAGLKGGHIYNTFPKMGDEWVASSVSYGIKTEGLSSLFNNISVVQFIHRTIAWVLALTIFFIGYYAKRKNDVSDKTLLSSEHIRAINLLIVIVLLQFLLGVFTLVYNVPITLGVLHQAGAFLLFTSAIYALKQFENKII